MAVGSAETQTARSHGSMRRNGPLLMAHQTSRDGAYNARHNCFSLKFMIERNGDPFTLLDLLFVSSPQPLDIELTRPGRPISIGSGPISAAYIRCKRFPDKCK